MHFSPVRVRRLLAWAGGFYENSKAARLVFEEASDGAGIDVAKLCFESDKETLSRTENSQIAIFTHSMAALAALRENGVAFKAAAGFSLGEYTSLAAAGVVTLADGVKIVSKRGKLMQHAADTIDGGMAAILGLEDAKIEEACAAVKNGIVRPVNYNCPGQLVIAGEKAALAEAIENCKAAGARRALPLAVSGAFHTPLMAEAAAELRAFVSDFTFSAPTMDIYSNLDGQVYDCSNLPEHLEQHMISPVRWTPSGSERHGGGSDLGVRGRPRQDADRLRRQDQQGADLQAGAGYGRRCGRSRSVKICTI